MPEVAELVKGRTGPEPRSLDTRAKCPAQEGSGSPLMAQRVKAPAVALLAAVAQVRSQGRELLHAVGVT